MADDAHTRDDIDDARCIHAASVIDVTLRRRHITLSAICYATRVAVDSALCAMAKDARRYASVKMMDGVTGAARV